MLDSPAQAFIRDQGDCRRREFLSLIRGGKVLAVDITLSGRVHFLASRALRRTKFNTELNSLALPVLLKFFAGNLRRLVQPRLQGNGLLERSARRFSSFAHGGQLGVDVLGALRETLDVRPRDVRQFERFSFVADSVAGLLQPTRELSVVHGFHYRLQAINLVIRDGNPTAICPLGEVHQQCVRVQLGIGVGSLRRPSRLMAELRDRGIAGAFGGCHTLLGLPGAQKLLFEELKRLGDRVIVSLNYRRVLASQRLDADTLGRRKRHIKRRARLGIQPDRARQFDVRTEITAQCAQKFLLLDGTSQPECIGRLALPLRSGSVTTVVIVFLVGVVVRRLRGGAPMDGFQRDH
ncbi:hypothetical protein D3C87_1079940 [compost metagenome]